jgi:predicted nucleotidyltransferase
LPIPVKQPGPVDRVGWKRSAPKASRMFSQAGRTRLTDPAFVCYHKWMNGQEIIARLRENEPALRARGVNHAALFGSRARGDNRPDSDIDIMVEFDPAARVTVFNYAGLKDYIASLFDGPVDVVNHDGLKPHVRPAATADAIYAF